MIIFTIIICLLKDCMTYTHKKRYAGSINTNNFYYKNAIFAHYQMSFLLNILPIELIEHIISYICSSLVVFVGNNTLYYINPRDNAILKTIQLSQMFDLNIYNIIYSISEDGLTLYSILNGFRESNIHIEYICDEKPDINKPIDAETLDENRYTYLYNHREELDTPILDIYSGTTSSLCSNGKYIAAFVNRSERCIAIYVTKTKEFFKEINISDPSIFINHITFSPDNKMIMAVSGDSEQSTIYMWNINTGEQLLNISYPMRYYDTNEIIWNTNSTKFAVSFITNEDEFGIMHYYSTHIIFGEVYNNICNITEHTLQVPGEVNNMLWITNEKFAYNFSSYIYITDSIGQEFISFPIVYKKIYALHASREGHLIITHNSFRAQDGIVEELDYEDDFENMTRDVWSDIVLLT